MIRGTQIRRRRRVAAAGARINILDFGMFSRLLIDPAPHPGTNLDIRTASRGPVIYIGM